jgi:hypothetical protein
MVSLEDWPLAPGFTTAGEKEQLACTGKPLQLKLIECENDPPIADTFTVYVALPPPVTVLLLGELAMLKSDPLPVRGTVCRLPDALSFTVKVPLRVPVALGLNVMLMVQLELGGNCAWQLLVCW